jgi:hypothetical protein
MEYVTQSVDAQMITPNGGAADTTDQPHAKLDLNVFSTMITTPR